MHILLYCKTQAKEWLQETGK